MLAVEGLLKGYDQLLNLVLDETVEFLRGNSHCMPGLRCQDKSSSQALAMLLLSADREDSTRTTDETRALGLVVSC